jgi:hypothetical protein
VEVASSGDYRSSCSKADNHGTRPATTSLVLRGKARGPRLRGAPPPCPHSALVVAPCPVLFAPPVQEGHVLGSGNPTTTPRAYLYSVEGPSVPAAVSSNNLLQEATWN